MRGFSCNYWLPVRGVDVYWQLNIRATVLVSVISGKYESSCPLCKMLLQSLGFIGYLLSVEEERVVF